jgi:presenilin-like A22 family membrane protease
MPQSQSDNIKEEREKSISADGIKTGQKTAARKTGLILAVSAVFFAALMAVGIISSDHLAGAASVKGFGASEVSVPNFLAIFILATLFFISLIYFLKLKKIKRAIFKIIFALVVFCGSTIFFKIWIGGIFAVLAGAALSVAWWLYHRVVVQNICLLFSMLGAGIFLGNVFLPDSAAFLLLVFSVYDLVAVYVTKHMVVMAKEMIASGALAAVFIPMDLSGLKVDINRVVTGGEKFLILGGGDIVFPLFFCVSMAGHYGIAGAMITAIFATAGFCASLYQFFNQRTRRPIPALPPIAFFSLLGYAVVFFLNN